MSQDWSHDINTRSLRKMYLPYADDLITVVPTNQGSHIMAATTNWSTSADDADIGGEKNEKSNQIRL